MIYAERNHVMKNLNNNKKLNKKLIRKAVVAIVLCIVTVSYTHLTLPTT